MYWASWTGYLALQCHCYTMPLYVNIFMLEMRKCKGSNLGCSYGSLISYKLKLPLQLLIINTYKQHQTLYCTTTVPNWAPGVNRKLKLLFLAAHFDRYSLSLSRNKILKSESFNELPTKQNCLLPLPLVTQELCVVIICIVLISLKCLSTIHFHNKTTVRLNVMVGNHIFGLI
jgi:hypothetical protein